MNLEALKIPVTKPEHYPCKVRVFADMLPDEYRQLFWSSVNAPGANPTSLTSWVSKVGSPDAPGRHSFNKHLQGGCDCES